jgi:hypothetical protein
MGSDLRSLVHEVHERIDKSNNIVIFNVDKEPSDSVSPPINLVETIFKTMDLNIPIVHAARLGKKSMKPRPLIIKLGRKMETLSVLKGKRKLRSFDQIKHAFIGVNLTTTQRTQYNDVKCQLDDKKRSGDDGWFITFVDDIPTLTKKKLRM